MAFNNQEETYAILKKYEYPDLKEDSVKDFCKAIIDFIEEDGNSDDFYLECFRQMLKENARKEQLIFVQDNEKGILINEYFLLRLGNCYMFKNSYHYFDEESEAEKK